MTVAGVTISGNDDEDLAEYFDGHEDAGDMLDPLVDNTETEEATEGQTEELARLAEEGVYETVDIHVASGQEASYDSAGSWTAEKTESEHDSFQASSRAMKRCVVSSRRAQLRAGNTSSTA